MKRSDVLLISIVLVAALAFMVPRWLSGSSDTGTDHNLVANITVDGKDYKTVKLTKEAQTVEIRTERGYNILKIHDYGVEMYDADCPDKVCLSFGFITRPKQTIVCLPHRVLVEIAGQAEGDEVDAYVQ